MKMKLSMLGLGILALSGCATQQPPREIRLSSTFDQSEMARRLTGGASTVSGNAFLRQQGGGVVTCAGALVELGPATEFAKERMGHLYGPGVTDGYLSARPNIRFVPDPPEFRSSMKQTKCDSQGRFSFGSLPEGDFYVITAVVWSVGGQAQGGSLMKLVHVSGDSTTDVIMSR